MRQRYIAFDNIWNSSIYLDDSILRLFTSYGNHVYTKQVPAGKLDIII